MYKQGIVRLGLGVDSLGKSPVMTPVTRIIVKTDSAQFSAGSNDGRTVAVENPFGSQKMANDLLQRLRGYAHVPMTAGGARLPPTAELGDAIRVKDIFTGIYSMKLTFGSGMLAQVASPGESEIDHEIPSRTKKERKQARYNAGTTSSIGKLNVKVDDLDEKYGTKIAGLSASIGDAFSQLVLLSQSLETEQTARATLAARVGTAEASITLTATRSEVDALRESVKSLVEIKADLITLNSKLTASSGAVTAERMWAKTSMAIGSGGLTCAGPLNFGGKEYSAKTITSTSGTVTILAVQ